MLLCEDAEARQCRGQVQCRSTRSWNLLQLEEHELIQASRINWSPSGGGGAKFRDSQPVPCCPRTRLGVPAMEPQKLWVHFPHSPGTVWLGAGYRVCGSVL